MNARLLRASDRTHNGGRIFRGMGQLQPVLIGRGRFGLELRIEGVAGGRPCWHAYQLPRDRTAAKLAFAELERDNAAGRPSAARLAWDRARDEQEARDNRPMAAPGLLSYRYRGSFGWIFIGARDDADALREAARSLSSGAAVMERLQIWDAGAGTYRPVAA